MKKLLCMLLAILMLATLFVGCGKTNDEPEAPAENPAPVEEAPEKEPEEEAPVEEAPEEPALPYEGVELSYWTSMTEGTAQATILSELTAEWEAATGAKVDINFNGNENRNLVTAALDAGDDLDIFYVPGTPTLTTLQDYCYDLTELAAAKGYEEKTYPLLLEQIRNTDNEGKLIGVVTQPSLNLVWYNKDIFADCGIENVPTTLDELEAACDAMVAKGYAPWALDSAYGAMTYNAILERYLGGDAIAELSMNGGWAENDLAVACAQRVLDWVNAGYFADGAPDEFPNSQNKIGLTGQVAMVYCGIWLGNEVDTSTGSAINWGTFKYPAYPDGNGTSSAPFSSNMDCINAKSANPEAAFDYLMYIRTGDGDQRYSDVAMLPPCDVNSSEVAALAGVKEAMAGSTEYVNGVSINTNSEIKAAIGDVVYKIFAGEFANGQEAMEAMDALYG